MTLKVKIKNIAKQKYSGHGRNWRTQVYSAEQGEPFHDMKRIFIIPGAQGLWRKEKTKKSSIFTLKDKLYQEFMNKNYNYLLTNEFLQYLIFTP